jgi:alkylhydroperoxidase family enzyme
MAHIHLTRPEEAEGPLREIYDAAVRRAGKVYGILQVMSPNPRVLRAMMDLYLAVMRGPSGLSRVRREMLATVTSRTNGCRY